MATYIRQGGQVALMFTEAEAGVLLELAKAGKLSEFEQGRITGHRRRAADRATALLTAALDPRAEPAGVVK